MSLSLLPKPTHSVVLTPVGCGAQQPKAPCKVTEKGGQAVLPNATISVWGTSGMHKQGKTEAFLFPIHAGKACKGH